MSISYERKANIKIFTFVKFLPRAKDTNLNYPTIHRLGLLTNNLQLNGEVKG